ncbi:MAG: Uma2 family endonuclease [Planctomycetes bacterium]|nr:Uma2 family endonuclease [Planctomycetota bacterium]
MSAVLRWNLVSVEDYLAGELDSPVKHEYLGGVVYAMTGARNQHNRIATDTLVAFGARLRGKLCQPFDSDTKIRVRLPTHTRCYYPDVSLVCRPNPPEDTFQDEPSVTTEVLSKKTRRVDEGEKKDAYLTIPSLTVYMLVEQELPLVTVFRRIESGFVREIYQGFDAIIPLPEIDVALPLAEIHANVRLVPEPDESDERPVDSTVSK